MRATSLKARWAIALSRPNPLCPPAVLRKRAPFGRRAPLIYRAAIMIVNRSAHGVSVRGLAVTPRGLPLGQLTGYIVIVWSFRPRATQTLPHLSLMNLIQKGDKFTTDPFYRGLRTNEFLEVLEIPPLSNRRGPPVRCQATVVVSQRN